MSRLQPSATSTPPSFLTIFKYPVPSSSSGFFPCTLFPDFSYSQTPTPSPCFVFSVQDHPRVPDGHGGGGGGGTWRGGGNHDAGSGWEPGVRGPAAGDGQRGFGQVPCHLHGGGEPAPSCSEAQGADCRCRSLVEHHHQFGSISKDTVSSGNHAFRFCFWNAEEVWKARASR